MEFIILALAGLVIWRLFFRKLTGRDKPEDLTARQAWYRNVYLNSSHWKNYLRPQALARAGYQCQRCHSKKQLDVHHQVYRKGGVYETQVEDLEVLCRPCHKLEHRRGAVHQWV